MEITLALTCLETTRHYGSSPGTKWSWPLTSN